MIINWIHRKIRNFINNKFVRNDCIIINNFDTKLTIYKKYQKTFINWIDCINNLYGYVTFMNHNKIINNDNTTIYLTLNISKLDISDNNFEIYNFVLSLKDKNAYEFGNIFIQIDDNGKLYAFFSNKEFLTDFILSTFCSLIEEEINRMNEISIERKKVLCPSI